MFQPIFARESNLKNSISRRGHCAAIRAWTPQVLKQACLVQKFRSLTPCSSERKSSAVVCVSPWQTNLCGLCERLVFLANHEVAAVLAAAALSVPSPAERPDSPFLITPAIDAAPSILPGSSVASAPPIRAISTVFAGAPFGNVAGIVKVPAIDSRTASSKIPRIVNVVICHLTHLSRLVIEASCRPQLAVGCQCFWIRVTKKPPPPTPLLRRRTSRQGRGRVSHKEAA
jgi:hypothetical protein